MAANSFRDGARAEVVGHLDRVSGVGDVGVAVRITPDFHVVVLLNRGAARVVNTR
jgi:hypothetical protein